uniref:C3H1-type domain-containing protein n=1 Tax=Chromera velia CCMP2878 TaxID=1169474 RepID=A0A0G4G4N0_9ALVE|eukprot:Cvel_4160.t1-p1 / transcript=Cvel_4160.t1 / gene=Cvel_4160 / organism=Chromera_velia_CCMP2878 / gene_product=Putative zinc finger CCCH domain-containing protein, putative / transcript_product=Putative zinc finger CCCH domain-containing protein, putative / location=Cvel_scaffold179:17887-21822(-) / protein_length=708 / sequence_SO=supercontig / SO=protein_coding / is_pseudo=false
MCPYLQKGNCRKQEGCTFAHSKEELRPLPDLAKTKICRDFRLGRCPNGKNCNFAHGVEELKATDDYYKTTMCRFWAQGLGCEEGALCRHAHGDAELRPRAYRCSERQKRGRGFDNTKKGPPPPPGSEDPGSTTQKRGGEGGEGSSSPSGSSEGTPGGGGGFGNVSTVPSRRIGRAGSDESPYGGVRASSGRDTHSGGAEDGGHCSKTTKLERMRRQVAEAAGDKKGKALQVKVPSTEGGSLRREGRGNGTADAVGTGTGAFGSPRSSVAAVAVPSGGDAAGLEAGSKEVDAKKHMMSTYRTSPSASTVFTASACLLSGGRSGDLRARLGSASNGACVSVSVSSRGEEEEEEPEEGEGSEESNGRGLDGGVVSGKQKERASSRVRSKSLDFVSGHPELHGGVPKRASTFAYFGSEGEQEEEEKQTGGNTEEDEEETKHSKQKTKEGDAAAPSVPTPPLLAFATSNTAAENPVPPPMAQTTPDAAAANLHFTPFPYAFPLGCWPMSNPTDAPPLALSMPFPPPAPSGISFAEGFALGMPFEHEAGGQGGEGGAGGMNRSQSDVSSAAAAAIQRLISSRSHASVGTATQPQHPGLVGPPVPAGSTVHAFEDSLGTTWFPHPRAAPGGSEGTPGVPPPPPPPPPPFPATPDAGALSGLGGLGVSGGLAHLTSMASECSHGTGVSVSGAFGGWFPQYTEEVLRAASTNVVYED